MSGTLHIVGTRIMKERLSCRPQRGGSLPFLLIGVSTLLAVEAPRIVSTDELIDYLYGGDPEGGPDYARDCIALTVMRLRRSGVPIRSHGHTGRGFRGYSYEATL